MSREAPEFFQPSEEDVHGQSIPEYSSPQLDPLRYDPDDPNTLQDPLGKEPYVDLDLQPGSIDKRNVLQSEIGNIMEAERLATEDPGKILDYIDGTMRFDVGGETTLAITEIAAKAAAEKAPDAAINYRHLYNEQPYAGKVLKTAAAKAYRLVLKDIEITLDIGRDHPYEEPYGKEMIQIAAETASIKEPALVFIYAYKFEKEPYAEKTIRTAAKRDPKAAVEKFSYYQNVPNARKIYEKALELIQK